MSSFLAGSWWEIFEYLSLPTISGASRCVRPGRWWSHHLRGACSAHTFLTIAFLFFLVLFCEKNMATVFRCNLLSELLQQVVLRSSRRSWKTAVWIRRDRLIQRCWTAGPPGKKLRGDPEGLNKISLWRPALDLLHLCTLIGIWCRNEMERPWTPTVMVPSISRSSWPWCEETRLLKTSDLISD